MKKLFVIDASGYLYRSYFAIRNMTNGKGESTNALFGFIRSIQKLRKDFQPHYLVSVFDGPRSIEKRKEIYSEYKAHRAVTPPDLSYQIAWAHTFCELAKIPHLSIPGIEADDAMGSVAVWGAQEGFHVYLCTSDKDLNQLVNDKISILNTFKENLISGPKQVEEAFGVLPSQMVDYLAMTGDTSDNVPGLPGFGPKTVSALLQQYGSLDYILEHPEVVTGKKQQVVKEYKEQVLMSRELVKIHTDYPIPKEEAFFALQHPPVEPLKEFYSRMNFSSLIRELDQEASVMAPPQESLSCKYHLVDEEESLKRLLEMLSQATEVAFALKGSHDQPIKSKLLGLSFAVNPGEAWYVPVEGKNWSREALLHRLKTIFENEKIHFLGHNIKFDQLQLEDYGIKVGHFSFDTMLASYLLNAHARHHSLEELMLEHLAKTKMTLDPLSGKGKKGLAFSDLSPEVVSAFCCEEVDAICQLRPVLKKQLDERGLTHILEKMELPLASLLAKMERAGIFLDKEHLATISQEVAQAIGVLEETIYAMAGEKFNINSPKQMSEILFGKLGIKALKKTATGLSTNADVLESLKAEYPICGKILEYRTLEKLRSTYIDALPLEIYPPTHRIHCIFNQTVAATGRLSCQDPNLQNIPIRTEEGRKIRGAFRPQKEGWSYLAADYSQVELRLLAHFSGDERLLKAFANSEDIHSNTAAAIFHVPLSEVTKEMRHHAKAVNFGIVYGQQAYGLSQELGIDVKVAAQFIETYFKLHPKVKQFIEESIAKTRLSGKAVTYLGRERLIPEINSKNMQIRSAAERLAMNTPLQGTAADLIKMAMLDIDEKMKREKLQSFMILQIHDELVFEVVDHEIEKLKSIVYDSMKGVFQLKVPLEVDIMIGKNWAEC